MRSGYDCGGVGLRFEKLVWPWVWGLVRWVDSVVDALGGGGGVESVVLVWVCDCFSDGFVVGCSRLGGGGSGMWVFFWGNFGGDRRVWLSFGGWCCGVCRRETKRQRKWR